MEPGVRIFLRVIVQCMSMLVLWMMLNTYFGIKLGLLFLDGNITVWHVVYYIAMVGSFAWVLRYIFKKWKEVPKFDVDDEDGPAEDSSPVH